MDNPEDIKYPDVPELDKLTELSDKMNVLAQFMEFLDEKGIVLKKWHEHGYLPADTRDLPYEFFELDPRKIEEERREVMKYLRLFNAAVENRKLNEQQ